MVELWLVMVGVGLGWGWVRVGWLVEFVGCCMYVCCFFFVSVCCVCVSFVVCCSWAVAMTFLLLSQRCVAPHVRAPQGTVQAAWPVSTCAVRVLGQWFCIQPFRLLASMILYTVKRTCGAGITVMAGCQCQLSVN
jgi:hypothetical protein